MRTATSSVSFFIVLRSSFDLARAAAHAVIRNVGGWRRGRDSNPRGGYKPPTRFPVAFLRPARTPLRTDILHEKPVPKIMAEREGFEPSVQFYPYNRLAGGCLQPARPPLPIELPTWRREQDSNLRDVAAQRFSRPPPSATRPSLHETCIYTRSCRREGAKKGCRDGRKCR